MSENLSRLARAAIWMLLPAVMSCATGNERSEEGDRYSARPTRAPAQALQQGPLAFIPAPEAAAPEALRWAVEAALSERHWNVDNRTRGHIQASVWSRGSGESATISVAYDTRGIQIFMVTASVNPNRYDRWIRLLVGNINAHVAQIGMGRTAAPWEQPAAAPPPPPAQPPAETAPQPAED